MDINSFYLSGALFSLAPDNIKKIALEIAPNNGSLEEELNDLKYFMSNKLLLTPNYKLLGELPEGIRNWGMLKSKLAMYVRRGRKAVEGDNFNYVYYYSEIEKLPKEASNVLSDGMLMSNEQLKIIDYYLSNVDFNQVKDIKKSTSSDNYFELPLYRLAGYKNLYGVQRVNIVYSSNVKIKKNEDLKSYLKNIKNQCEEIISLVENGNETELLNLDKSITDSDYQFSLNYLKTSGVDDKYLKHVPLIGRSLRYVENICILLEYANDFLNLENLISIFDIPRKEEINLDTSNFVKGQIVEDVNIGYFVIKEIINKNTLLAYRRDEDYFKIFSGLDNVGFYGIHEKSFDFIKDIVKSNYYNSNSNKTEVSSESELYINTRLLLKDASSKLKRLFNE